MTESQRCVQPSSLRDFSNVGRTYEGGLQVQALYAGLHTVDDTLSQRWARTPHLFKGDFVTLWVQSHQLMKKSQATGGELVDSQFLQRPGKGGDRSIVHLVGEIIKVKVCEIREIVDESDDRVGRDAEKP